MKKVYTEYIKNKQYLKKKCRGKIIFLIVWSIIFVPPTIYLLLHPECSRVIVDNKFNLVKNNTFPSQEQELTCAEKIFLIYKKIYFPLEILKYCLILFIIYKAVHLFKDESCNIRKGKH